MILETIVLPFKLYLVLKLIIFIIIIYKWSGQDLNLHQTRYERGTIPLSYQTLYIMGRVGVEPTD